MPYKPRMNKKKPEHISYVFLGVCMDESGDALYRQGVAKVNVVTSLHSNHEKPRTILMRTADAGTLTAMSRHVFYPTWTETSAGNLELYLLKPEHH